jgi:glutathione synthase/RimK-type ligase-like ATP-grasp enzyme
MTDVTILTERRYFKPDTVTPYIANILKEYSLLKEALEGEGLLVNRTSWDNPEFDFTKTRAVVFRTIWDYFERFDEFFPWLRELDGKTMLINPLKLIEWNIDKHYLADLNARGFATVPTIFVDRGKDIALNEVCRQEGWEQVVIKPAVSGAGFETYKIDKEQLDRHEALFARLVTERDMLVQPFVSSIIEKGEASLMVFGGQYTHAILKKAKPGDFRVQDDFGGSVHPYQPTAGEIELAIALFRDIDPVPAYGRVDIVWDETGNALISELEIIEPELWLRNHPPAAADFAKAIKRQLDRQG